MRRSASTSSARAPSASTACEPAREFAFGTAQAARDAAPCDLRREIAARAEQLLARGAQRQRARGTRRAVIGGRGLGGGVRVQRGDQLARAAEQQRIAERPCSSITSVQRCSARCTATTCARRWPQRDDARRLRGACARAAGTALGPLPPGRCIAEPTPRAPGARPISNTPRSVVAREREREQVGPRRIHAAHPRADQRMRGGSWRVGELLQTNGVRRGRAALRSRRSSRAPDRRRAARLPVRARSRRSCAARRSRAAARRRRGLRGAGRAADRTRARGRARARRARPRRAPTVRSAPRPSGGPHRAAGAPRTPRAGRGRAGRSRDRPASAAREPCCERVARFQQPLERALERGVEAQWATRRAQRRARRAQREHELLRALPHASVAGSGRAAAARAASTPRSATRSRTWRMACDRRPNQRAASTFLLRAARPRLRAWQIFPSAATASTMPAP